MTQKIISSSDRPLSPHLGIYRWQITMVLSILHRVTGAALVVGTALLVGWLWSAAYDPECFAGIHKFLTSVLGRLMLIGWTFAFYFHFCNGIRHLFWDIGKGFALPVAARSGWAVVVMSIFFTVCTWMTILGHSGGAQ